MKGYVIHQIFQIDSFLLYPVVPELYENFPSRITFWWVTPLIFNGYKRPLTEEDCWQLALPERAVNIVHRVQACIEGLIFSSFYPLFYYDEFYRKINRAKSLAYQKSRSLSRPYSSDEKKIEDESQDLVSFVLSIDSSRLVYFVFI
jgi:hypothetical protein